MIAMMQDKIDLLCRFGLSCFPARLIMMEGVNPLYACFRAYRCENLSRPPTPQHKTRSLIRQTAGQRAKRMMQPPKLGPAHWP
jgi:hypothetical protein